MVRNPGSDAAKALTALPNVTVVKGDFEDAGSLKAALLGVQRAFLVSPAGRLLSLMVGRAGPGGGPHYRMCVSSRGT